MPEFLQRITVLCFGASYGAAFLLELLHYFRPRPIFRLVGIGFGIAGLFAQTAYVFAQPVSLTTTDGSLLFLAWILAIFYLYGTFHHQRIVWGLFVLPLVLTLVILAVAYPTASQGTRGSLWNLLVFDGRFWGTLHGVLVLLAAVGVCVGFVASLMYLVHAHRLKAKLKPQQGMKLLSLERIEEMNRRAILISFPLLTAGLLIGVGRYLQKGFSLAEWNSPRILSSVALWLVFAILLYLRYGIHARGKRVAWWTIGAFVLLLAALLSPVHPFVTGGSQ